MPGVGFMIGKHLMVVGDREVFLLPGGGGNMDILLELSVKAGKTGISHSACNQIDWFLVQMKKMACLLNSIMLNVF